jgi:hypothetical protein
LGGGVLDDYLVRLVPDLAQDDVSDVAEGRSKT